MTPDHMMSELAGALRDAINDTPCDTTVDPEEAHVDLACRLVLRLARKKIALVPALDFEPGQAALRIFNIFTSWLESHPERHYVTTTDGSGKFELIMRERGETKAYFRGETAQDAYAQAAQAISFNGGVL